jgi:hypothetical protein
VVAERLPAETVADYYTAVLADRAPEVRELRRRLAATDAIVEPIGWTVSGKPFATVVSGLVSVETRIVEAPRGYRRDRVRRHGRIPIEIVSIHALSLPFYFDAVGESRIAFASIERDRIYLDRREELDPLVMEEAIEHETMHLLDRPLFGRIPHVDLEIRAMIRGLARGEIARLNIERLEYAVSRGREPYRTAGGRILEALEEATDRVGSARPVTPEVVQAVRDAARAFEILLDL